MSRIHRAVEKAEREGLLTWTGTREDHGRATLVEEPPATAPVRPPAPAPEADDWDAAHVPDAEPHTDGNLRLSPLFVAATEPGCAAAEQYRLLRTKLESRDPTRRTQLVLVSSPRAGDGKTITSANLALTMAQEFQHRVVLVEADLRKPSLAALFGVRSEPGLVDVLVGAVSLEDALIPVPGQRLFLLPAGLTAARSSELLASSLMRRVLDELRTRFDRIVVDSPPVVLADTHVLARIADGLLIVVRAGVTPRPAVERALGAVDRQKFIGVVLNEVEQTPGEYSYPGRQSRGLGAA